MIIQSLGGVAPIASGNAGAGGAPAPVTPPQASGALPAASAQGIVQSSSQSGSQQGAAPGQVQSAVNSINQSMQFMNRDITFAVDPNTHETVVKVVEGRSGTVIAQIPSEQVLAIAQAIDTLQQGLLVRQKA